MLYLSIKTKLILFFELIQFLDKMNMQNKFLSLQNQRDVITKKNIKETLWLVAIGYVKGWERG
jgi:hypothetical protein